MRRLHLPTLFCLAALALQGCTPGERPGAAAAATYANPVLDTDFPDPAVLRASDGYYYAYATQSDREGKKINIQTARSPDLVRWEMLPDALPAKPAWASKTQDFWAPHVSEHQGRFYLYYSAKPDAALTDEKQGLCLAVATATRPEGPFTDIGKPLQCGLGFVNIDPMAYDDPRTGKRLLYWGSGFEAIKVQELAPDRVSFAPGSKPVELIQPVKTDDPRNYQRLIEGAWVTYRAPYYYLFYSGDNCCGPKAHYAALVARSKSATGPFEQRGELNRPILEASGNWLAPGHNSVITDAAGRDWMVYHAVDTRRPRTKPTDDLNTRRVMLIDPISYRSGWPELEGGGPSTGQRPAPAARRR